MVQTTTSLSAMLSSTPPKARPSYAHPLDPLTASEIRHVVDAVRSHLVKSAKAPKPITKALFNSISLREPSKYAVLQWAGTFSRKELSTAGAQVDAPLNRQADVHIICPESGRSFEAVVDLPSNLPGTVTITDPVVTSWTILDGLLQPSLQPEELLWAEEVCKKDAKVKEACDAIGVDQQNIAVDGWCIGQDERFPGRRLQQCFIFARLRPDDNLYAHPCDFVPVLDSHTGEVLSIDYPPTNPAPGESYPASSAKDYEAGPKRARIPPPMTPQNYLPEQIAKDDPTFKVRDTLKPLHVLQPEGVSYRMDGRTLRWQNWNIHVGFTYREGLVLSNITYDDGAKGSRPLFYRLSVAEMVVPYAKTIFPHHRKHAFDTGEYGIGALANSLALGCDCLGSITYLDAEFVTRAGGIETIKSAICIHEEDAGILHKHTDFRDMRAHVARNRKLVISSICTVANYEYGFYFNFALDGSIELEVKATGIVNAYCLGPNEPRDPSHEVEVAPNIAAQHHQHLFSYRIDPMLDGLNNSVVQVDSVQDDEDVGSATNFYGNGFKTVKTVYKTAKGAVADYDATKARCWVIENPNKKHYCTGGNVGYKLMSKDMPPLLAKPGSLVWNRAPFARHNMFVTPHSDEEIFPSELHINQHPGGEDFGLQTWVNRDENVENADIVAWPCFGVTHISRPEDWPIMPVEILRVHLKPSGFFDRNPGLDVPSSADKKSRHATEAFTNGTSNGHVNGHAAVANGNGMTNGASSCCSSRN
ncbi:Copper amine oxidase 1 [Saitozyma sp. JCM 24511]|nr:Copper amine oxidase 1 [Saitozyma sp. JCM 24511]